MLSTPTVPEFLTGREFLKFFMDINEKSLKNPRSIDEYFDSMSIAPEDRDKLLKDYSHGMKNKMQMLINIIAQPNVLLLDEPLTSLDVVVAEEMKQLLRSLKQGRITIFSTHIMDLALDLCDEIVLLNHGELEVVEKTNLDSGEFKEKIHCGPAGGRNMRKTLRISFALKNTYRVNGILYSLKADPALKALAAGVALSGQGPENLRECAVRPVGNRLRLSSASSFTLSRWFAASASFISSCRKTRYSCTSCCF